MSNPKQNLFAGFDTASKKEWAEQATLTLNNGKLEKYSWQLEDDLILAPYYDGSDLTPLKKLTFFQNQLFFDQNWPRYWENLQKIEVKDPLSANHQSREILKQADGIIFDLRKTDKVNFEQLLSHIFFDHYNISFLSSSSHFQAHLENYRDLVDKRGFDKKDIKSAFTGENGTDRETMVSAFKNSFEFPYLRVLNLKSDQHHSSDQIADLLLQAVQLFDFLAGDFDIISITRKMMLAVSVSTDYFAEMAKIRALRMLFFQLCQSYGDKFYRPSDIHIHAVSPVWTDEQYQPHANVLKGTTAAMAAILGGCNSLYIEPGDDKNPALLRLARNISTIIREESFFDKSTDPAAGSYYIEALTDKLAQKAWRTFQERIKENNN